MKSSTQLKALIRNLSKEKNINPQILMRCYMMERLLERIYHSRYKDNFILKGGMLVASMIGVDLRATIDMDTTVKGMKLNAHDMAEVFNELVVIDLNDGIQLVVQDVDEIREDAEYKGIRVSLTATIDRMEIPVKVDITTGDRITPKEVVHSYEMMLEDRSINILAYNIETVLAEKIETVISRGIANTRMRDFYDLYMLYRLYKVRIEMVILSEALLKTAQGRGTVAELSRATTTFDQIEKDPAMENLWARYQKSYPYAGDVKWIEITSCIRSIWNDIHPE